MNLYSRYVDAFIDESEQVGLLFATHATLAMADAQNQERLYRAMEVRDLIGQAKGILMERYRLTGDRGVRLRVRASQHGDTKLVEMARYLVETGDLAPASARNSRGPRRSHPRAGPALSLAPCDDQYRKHVGTSRPVDHAARF